MFNVAVIGGGVSGLTSALFIQKKCKELLKVTLFSKEFSPNTTGDIAAGLWTPYLIGNTAVEDVFRWSTATQDYILKLWKGGKAKEYGISLEPILTFSGDKDFQIPDWAKQTIGFHQFNEEQLKSFSKKFKRNIVNGFMFVSFIWEAIYFLPRFQELFVRNGGVVKQREVCSFEELEDFDIIVNCTGLEANVLTNDKSLTPIRGQIMRVAAPWQYHTMFFDFGDGNYIIPNTDSVVLGGTHQEGDYNCQVNKDDVRHILEGCSHSIPSLKTAPIIKHAVGLRPGRDKIRLELEERENTSGRKKFIVHNYGHGGSGITVSIGCAKNVANLVSEAIMIAKSKL